jgi:hypothetical protein
MNAAIIARLGLDASDMKKGLQSAAASVKQFGGTVMGAFGVSLGGAALVAAGKSLLEYGGKLRDTADGVGVGTDALQELQYAFVQSGATIEQTDKALVKLNQTLTAAREGDEKLVASFAKLGITQRDLMTLTPDQAIMRMADASKDAANKAENLSAIMDVLGKSGVGLAPGLRAGTDELIRLREEAGKLSEEEIALLARAGEGADRLANALKIVAAHSILAFADPGKEFGLLDQLRHIGKRIAGSLGIEVESDDASVNAPDEGELKDARDAINAANRTRRETFTPAELKKMKEREAAAEQYQAQRSKRPR